MKGMPPKRSASPKREDLAEFGRRLIFLRKHRGYKQKDLARFAETGESHISDLEGGLVDPTFDLINRLAKALNVKPIIFFLEPSMAKALVGYVEIPPKYFEGHQVTDESRAGKLDL